MKQARQNFKPPYSCLKDWPEDCFVQAGDSGVVFCKEGNSYRTAFFEAFPRDPDTFIRGEGKTIVEAEDQAWARFQKQVGCEADHTDQTSFSRRSYRNGLGFCVKCGLSRMVFEPLEICEVCGVNTYHCCYESKWYCREHVPEAYTKRLKAMFDDDAA